MLVDTKTDFRAFEHLDHLSDSEIESLARVSSLMSLEKGQVIFNEGDAKNDVYLLVSGSVKTGSRIGEDKLLIKNIVHKNSFFGENIFASNTTRKEFAEALSSVEYYQIPAEHFRKMAEQNQEFANYILDIIVARLFELEERLKNFVFKSAKERIMFFIKTTGERRGIKIGMDECLINHGMSHKEIASLTDTSRQTVARVLSELKRTNVIHFSPRKPNKILIRDMASL
jgi:CRP-like cAMP-binding protein